MSEKGFILGAFSFGFGFSFLIGYLPYKFGGVTMYGIGVLLTGILALLSPILVRLHLYAFLFARALQGLFEVSHDENFSVTFITIFLIK